jgi:hypothetical protein
MPFPWVCQPDNRPSDEPHRRQVGRMVDRVNLLGTIRLYAMKNFSIIRDADVHLRIYGQLLDRVMSEATEQSNRYLDEWWTTAYEDARRTLDALGEQEGELAVLSSDRLAKLQNDRKKCADSIKREIEELQRGKAVTEAPLMLYRRVLDDIAAAAPKGVGVDVRETNIFAKAREALNSARKAKSRHDEDMAQLNRRTDLNLTRIKTYIDDLGGDAIGGLPFRINRSRFYAEIYRRMVETLRVGTIDTWWDYKQLAARGVEPAFRFIENVGDRLERLRTRLRDAMEAVQTSAIANQTEATRDNTFQLELIASEIRDVNARLADQNASLSTIKKFYYAAGIIGSVVGLAILAYALFSGECIDFKIGRNLSFKFKCPG